LESGEDWFLLELPAELEDGTLLAPNVLSRKKLDVLRLSMGAAAFATQFLQRPGDASNSIPPAFAAASELHGESGC
jgi:hypothetical protein